MEGKRNRAGWWARLVGGGVLLALLSACAGAPDPAARPRTATAASRPAATTAHAATVANRTKRARALYRSAKRALRRGHYGDARRLALRSRELRKTAAARAVLNDASRGIAKAEAAARERRRLARIARDARTCTAAEKRIVRGDGSTPAGCAGYAAELAAEPEPAQDCDPNYTGACLKPESSDYDCAGGSGNGPDYTGPVQSVGDDPYDLDRDGDGLACESS